LTASRSIAVDRKLHTYGMPFFIDATLPFQSTKPDTRFQRLMIAQDTGGAIIGPARADIYLGAGEEAARAAGRFKHFGQFVMLVPNELDPGNIAQSVPLPLPKPNAGDKFIKVADQVTDEIAVSTAKTAKPAVAVAAVPLPKARPAKRNPGKPAS